MLCYFLCPLVVGAASVPSRLYLEHVRVAFGGFGPPPAFPTPGAAAAAARMRALRSSEGGDGGGLSPCLMHVRVGDVSADVTPPATGETLCRSLLVRRAWGVVVSVRVVFCFSCADRGRILWIFVLFLGHFVFCCCVCCVCYLCRLRFVQWVCLFLSFVFSSFFFFACALCI